MPTRASVYFIFFTFVLVVIITTLWVTVYFIQKYRYQTAKKRLEVITLRSINKETILTGVFSFEQIRKNCEKRPWKHCPKWSFVKSKSKTKWVNRFILNQINELRVEFYLLILLKGAERNVSDLLGQLPSGRNDKRIAVQPLLSPKRYWHVAYWASQLPNVQDWYSPSMRHPSNICHSIKFYFTVVFLFDSERWTNRKTFSCATFSRVYVCDRPFSSK